MVEPHPAPQTRKRLGRGLAGLMSQPVAVSTDATRNTPRQSAPQTLSAPSELPASGLLNIPAADIHPSRHQPRKDMDSARLEALAASIRQSGVMQPILVRRWQGGQGYELIAGERRWRAAQLAGLTTLPALVRDLDDSHAAEWALVENLQREDLDPIERAEAFQSLVVQFSLTHSQIAERVGMDRSSVANTIRLNSLDEDTKADVRTGRLSQGHAKALLSITDPHLRRTMAASVLRQGWTVRRLEREIESWAKAQAGQPRIPTTQPKAQPITELEERLSKSLRLPARIRQSRSRTSGQIIFTFRTLDEFEAFLARAER